jgi:hypothetical protein
LNTGVSVGAALVVAAGVGVVTANGSVVLVFVLTFAGFVFALLAIGSVRRSLP